MDRYSLKTSRALRKVSCTLSLVLGLAGALLPASVNAQEQSLTWARVDFIRNRVQLVPKDQQGRRANVSDVLSVGDALRTARASRAEIRFNDDSLARIGERATFRFTPNTRNFQLSDGTVLLLIPPGRGRSTIQTPNAVTGIQGSALFVRYIPETDTTIVGALTNNPNGPMVLFNRDGTEQQALRANEIGVIQGDQITELYEFDGTLFWQSSGLAEGFNYLSNSSTGSDALDGVRQEIREAISSQGRISGDRVLTNPDNFANTDSPEGSAEADSTPAPEIEFEDSPAQDYLESSTEAVDESSLEVGVNNSLVPATDEEEDLVAETTEDSTDSSALDPSESESTTEEDLADGADGDVASDPVDDGNMSSGSVTSGVTSSDSEVTSSDGSAEGTGAETTVSEDVVTEDTAAGTQTPGTDGIDSDGSGADTVDSVEGDNEPVIEVTEDIVEPDGAGNATVPDVDIVTDDVDVEAGSETTPPALSVSEDLTSGQSGSVDEVPGNTEVESVSDSGTALGTPLPAPLEADVPSTEPVGESQSETVLGVPAFPEGEIPDSSALETSLPDANLSESTVPDINAVEVNDVATPRGDATVADSLIEISDPIQSQPIEMMMGEDMDMADPMDSDDMESTQTVTPETTVGDPIVGSDAP